MPVSLRKLPKNAFKRKIKQALFEILASEDCYIDLPEIARSDNLNRHRCLHNWYNFRHSMTSPADHGFENILCIWFYSA